MSIGNRHMRFIESQVTAKEGHCKIHYETAITVLGNEDGTNSTSDNETDSYSDRAEVEHNDSYNGSSTFSCECYGTLDTDGEEGNKDSDCGDETSHPSDDGQVITEALTHTPARPVHHDGSDTGDHH